MCAPSPSPAPVRHDEDGCVLYPRGASPYTVRINNRVVRTPTRPETVYDLERLLVSAGGDYNKKKFPTSRLRGPNASCSVSRSGIVVANGARRMDSVLTQVWEVVRLLSCKSGRYVHPVALTQTNVSCSIALFHYVDLARLARCHRDRWVLSPRFPGATFKSSVDVGAESSPSPSPSSEQSCTYSITVYGSGSVLLSGLRKPEAQLSRIIHGMLVELEPFYTSINMSAVVRRWQELAYCALVPTLGFCTDDTCLRARARARARASKDYSTYIVTSENSPGSGSGSGSGTRSGSERRGCKRSRLSSTS